MIKKLFMAMAVMLTSMTAFAQLTEGFYRVQNKASQRYLYVKDCTGDISTLGADMAACELWPNLEDAISDPGSVMYLKKMESSWDITSQSTGVYEMTGYNMNISVLADGTCMVYAKGQYLYEIGVSALNKNQGRLGAKTASEMQGKGEYRVWNTPKIDSNSSNYFGFKPTVTANGKSYAPFYADFAYTPKNNNVKTWYVSEVDKKNAIAVIKEITGTVAKQQAVFVECVSANTSDNKVDLTTAAGTAAQSNLMKGVFFCNADRSSIAHPDTPAVVEFNASTMRLLGTGSDGKLAFVNTSPTLVTTEISKKDEWVDAICIPHNSSYLTVDADCPAELKVMTQAEYDEFKKSQSVTGDVNGDNKVNVADLQGVNKIIAAGTNDKKGDVNNDGKVNVADLQAVCKIIATK